MEALAREIHETRIAGLYVDLNEDGLQIPTEAIADTQAETLIRLAEARIRLCETEIVRIDLSADEMALQSWFLEKSDDPESRKMIFSPASMKKMAELKSGLKWVQWLKSLFDEAESAGLKLAEKEIQRGLQLREQEAPSLWSKQKWRVKNPFVYSITLDTSKCPFKVEQDN